MWLLLPSPLPAAEPSPIELRLSDEVLYCSVGPVDAQRDIVKALKEGTPVAFRWQLVVEEKADYWLNSEVGTVELTRYVIPDLVSRHWLLKDENSGIIRKTSSLEEALRFLTELRQFPVIDRSLIQPGETYQLKVGLYIHEGKIEDKWWLEMLRFNRTIGTREFRLP